MHQRALHQVGRRGLGQPVDDRLKRKARAQSLKLLTLDGDRERGTGRAMAVRLRRGCVAAAVQRRPRTDRASASGSSRGPKWPRSSNTSTVGLAEPGGEEGEEAGADGVGLGPAGQGHRAPDSVQVGEGVVGQAVGVDLGLVLAAAAQADAPRHRARSRCRRRRPGPRGGAGRTVACSAKLSMASSREPNTSRRRRAPTASGLPSAVGGQGAVAGVHDRLDSSTEPRTSPAGTARPAAAPPPRRNGRRRTGRSRPSGRPRPAMSAANPYQPKSSPGGGSDTSVGPRHRRRCTGSARPDRPPGERGRPRRSRWRGPAGAPVPAPEVVVGDADTVRPSSPDRSG